VMSDLGPWRKNTAMAIHRNSGLVTGRSDTRECGDSCVLYSAE